MADFTDLTTSDQYAQLLTDLNDRIKALEQQLSVGSHTGLANEAKRHNPAQKRRETYNGSTWGPTESEYNENVKQLQGAEPDTAASNNSIAKRTSTGRLKASAPSASNDVTRKAELDAHAGNTSNPHGVTAAQAGALGLHATADNSAKLGGNVAANFPEKAVAETITGGWDFTGTPKLGGTAFGNAATKSVGTGANQVPQNSDLGSEAYLYRGATEYTNADSPVTLTEADAGLIVCDASSGSISLTLPPASTNPGVTFCFTRVDTATSSFVAVDGSGNDVFNAAITSSVSLSLDIHDSASIISDGVSGWFLFDQTASSIVLGKVFLASTFAAQSMISGPYAITPSNLDSLLLGWGQTWQDMSASRAINTTYTNTSGRTIYVATSLRRSGGRNIFYINGSVVSVRMNNWFGAFVTLPIPPGDTYKADAAIEIGAWWELR